jgi:hypothetical protein
MFRTNSQSNCAGSLLMGGCGYLRGGLNLTEAGGHSRDKRPERAVIYEVGARHRPATGSPPLQ